MTNTNETNQRSLLEKIADEAMLDKGFLIEFPASALASLANQPEKIVKISAPVQDLRSLAWCSIDNDDSEDLDQLSVAVPDTDGVKILIAVADVDSAVDKNSSFEDHARHNTTSVYTPAKIFPMLPLKFSTDLTSMNLSKDRMAIIVEFSLAGDGSIKNSSIYPALVQNKAKLAYHSTGDWLEGHGTMPAAISLVDGLELNIKLQRDAAEKLKTVRYQSGALNLETIQARPVFNRDQVSDLQEDRMNIAKDIIQEFMICANSITARFLSLNHIPFFRRVVRTPKRWDRIIQLAGEWQFSLPAIPDPKSLDEFLQFVKAKDSIRFPDVSLSVVKLLGAGEYVVEKPGEESTGHFGLALKDYTHSTAPNRRYPDLITQRLLKAKLYGTPVPYTSAELEALAAHCTQMEDQSRKVERQVQKSAAALLLHAQIGTNYDGIITGVSDKGTWVRIFHPPVDGKIVSDVQGLDVGDRVRVQLTRTDVARGFIDFKKIN